MFTQWKTMYRAFSENFEFIQITHSLKCPDMQEYYIDLSSQRVKYVRRKLCEQRIIIDNQ